MYKIDVLESKGMFPGTWHKDGFMGRVHCHCQLAGPDGRLVVMTIAPPAPGPPQEPSKVRSRGAGDNKQMQLWIYAVYATYLYEFAAFCPTTAGALLRLAYTLIELEALDGRWEVGN